MKWFTPPKQSNASFILLGATWVLQFCVTLVSIILDMDGGYPNFYNSGVGFGIANAVILLVAAWEDLHYDTHHLKTVIILAIFMNVIMYYLALLGIVAIVAGFVVCFVGGPLLMYGGTTVLTIIGSGGVIGTTVGSVLTFLFLVGTIIGGVVASSAAW